MRRIAYAILILASIGPSLPAGAECWTWEKKALTGDYPGVLMNPQAVFDKNVQKIALFPYYNYPSDPTQLYYYDETKWEIAWEGGAIDMGGHSWGFGGATAMYFDDALDTLMLVGWICYGFEDCGTGIFKFVPNQGYKYKADFHLGLWWPWACYDSLRGMVVFGGAIGGSNDGMTVEYDGQKFEYFYNPEGYTLSQGKAAFDPEIGRVVYFGPNRKDQGLETLEWDGASWTIVTTTRKPPQVPDYMVYIPDFHGIMAVVNDCKPWECFPMQTWLYREKEWFLLEIHKDLVAWGNYAFLVYDPNRHKAILGGVPHSALIESTWELAPGRHCRPIAKP